jgi:hypothetical protein
MDLQVILLIVLILSALPFLVVAQPTMTRQKKQDKAMQSKAKNLKEHVYTIVEKFPNRSYKNIA